MTAHSKVSKKPQDDRITLVKQLIHLMKISKLASLKLGDIELVMLPPQEQIQLTRNSKKQKPVQPLSEAELAKMEAQEFAELVGWSSGANAVPISSKPQDILKQIKANS